MLDRPTAPPKELTTPLNASIVSKFAIFRRTLSARDQPSPESSVEGAIAREIAQNYKLSSYYPAYVRRVIGVSGSQLYFIIPGFARSEPLPPLHCLTTRARRELAGQQKRRSFDPVYCIIATLRGKSEPVSGCESFAATVEGGSLFDSAAFTGKRIVEMAPNGVVSVRISYRTGTPIVEDVHENVFVLYSPPLSYALQSELNRLRQELEEPSVSRIEQKTIVMRYDAILAQAEPTSVDWLNAAGQDLRTIIAPHGGNTKTSVGNLRAPIEG